MGKPDGKVAVITGATSGMAPAGAKLFVDEGAHVFIQGRRRDSLDEAVGVIGRNVTGVQGDSASLDDLDRLYETVKQEKGSLDVLWASAGAGKQGRLGEITDEEFDAAFSLNARGTLFTVQKALPLGGRAEGQEDPGQRADPDPPVPRREMATLKRSRRSRCSSPRTTRATSMARRWLSTAAPR